MVSQRKTGEAAFPVFLRRRRQLVTCFGFTRERVPHSLVKDKCCPFTRPVRGEPVSTFRASTAMRPRAARLPRERKRY